MNESLEAPATKAKGAVVMESIHPKPIPLHQLLDRSSASGRLGKLSREECLHLAVIVSTSALQLYSTPWCPDTLSTQSIQLTALPTSEHRSLFIAHPYLKSKIECQNRKPPSLPLNGFHPDLVALGIILLELSEKKPISQWWKEQTSQPLPVDWYEEEASERMSSSYRWAFRHCLNVDSLDIVVRERMTFADAGFRDTVYQNIVVRLETAYKEYTKPITT